MTSSRPRCRSGSAFVLTALRVGFAAAFGHESFERAVVFAANLGGDADTNAAVAGALAGARFGVAGIPERWLEPLLDRAPSRGSPPAFCARSRVWSRPVTTKPDRNLALELVRVTEVAAIACARWVGFGEKIAADQAAVDAMRIMLATVDMEGVVVIGEGEKDEAPMLYNGEHIGSGTGAELDVAVDPLEGTELVARGQPNALAVVAAAEKGAMFDPGPVFYMEKLACGAGHRRGDRHHARRSRRRSPRSPRPSAARCATSWS